MKNPSLSHQERKYREVFDGFPAVFGAFGGVISLRQGLSDSLLAKRCFNFAGCQKNQHLLAEFQQYNWVFHK